MRTVYQAENAFDAQLVKDALDDAEIPAFIVGLALTGALGELPAMGLIEIKVPDGAEPAARAVVERVDAFLKEERDDGWQGVPA